MDFLKTKETGFKGPGEIRVRGGSLKILKDIYADNSLKNEERIDPGIFWHDEEYGLSQRDATEALSCLDKVDLIKIVPPKVVGAGLAGSVVEKIPGLKECLIKHFYLLFSGNDCETFASSNKPDWFDPIVLDRHEALPNP